MYVIGTRKPFLDYVRPHNYDYVCFMVKKPPLDPKWWNLVKPFHPTVWFGIFLASITSFVFIVIYAKFYPKSEIRIVDAVKFMYGIFFCPRKFIHQKRKGILLMFIIFKGANLG